MISYINGRLAFKGEDSIIVDRDGIGFNIQVSSGMLQRLPSEGENVRIYTYMNVKEDEISLFGFASMEELGFFNKLIRVSGVGPKSAAGLLGVFTPRQLSVAIAAEDSRLISTGPGIGKKTAQKIILELKDRITEQEIFAGNTEASSAPKANANSSEAIQALESLGFTRAEAFKAVNAVAEENMDSGKIISLALKALSR